MDLDLTPKSNSTRSPEDGEIDTPPHAAQPIKPKNHHHHPPPPAAAAAPSYKECMRNHAATLGGHAVDGCGEFMPSPSATAADPASLKCAACGCHRSFHRREPESPTAAITPPFLDFRHPPLPKRFSLSPSPPPPQAAAAAVPPYSVFFGLGAAEEHHQAPVTPTVENPAGRKRFRTKFSQEQKEKMQSFSAGLGWKLQKCDEAAVREFCREIGVTKGVLKVWMHNNKNTFGKKLEMGSNGGGAIGFGNNGNGSRKSEDDDDDDGDGGGRRFQNNSGNNGSSSSP